MKKFRVGAHSLSSMFTIDKESRLRRAMQETVAAGGTLFELPYLLCQVPWKKVALIAREEGIKEIALCHFWPMGTDKVPVYGNPLAHVHTADYDKCFATLADIMQAIQTIRSFGVTVRFLDGPLWGCLGWGYGGLPDKDRQDRAISFLRDAGDMCKRHQVKLAVEFLRPREDKVIAGTNNMIQILNQVGHTHVGMHFDVFHSIECGENPAAAIARAKEHIVYLHLHGSKRRAPGSEDDTCNWPEIIEAVKLIRSDTQLIPVVCEPFGADTIRENPDLGEGLPVPPPLPEYLGIAYGTFRECGLPIAA